MGQNDGVRYLGGDAQVLEEALVRRPELAPHGLAHAVLGVDQLGGVVELLHGLHPELDARVVHLDEVVRQRDLFDLERHAMETELTRYVHSCKEKRKRDQSVETGMGGGELGKCWKTYT